MRVNISKNNANDVDYDFELNGGPTGPFTRWWNGYGTSRAFSSMAYAWSGMVWAPNYSAKGAIVVHGGGHGGFQGQFVYIFDLSTRQWSRIGIANLPPNFEWAGFMNVPLSTYTAANDLRDQNWMDYPYNGGHIMMHDHSYNTVEYVTPAEGGGTKGSLLIPSAPKTQNPSDYPSVWAPHLFNLATGVITRAMSAPTGTFMEDNNNYICVKDTTRSNIWYFKHGSITCWKQILAGGPPFAWASHVIQKSSGGNTDTYIPGYAKAWEYCPEADAIVALNCGFNQLNAPVWVHVFDMSTGVPIDLKLDGIIPQGSLYHGGYNPSFEWCPDQQAFYIYEGLGDNYCTVLRPSSLSFATCSWTWSKERFDGVAPVNARGSIGLMTTLEGAHRRFFWSPFEKCFVWNDGPDTSGVCLDNVTRNGVAQMWRPPGAVIA